MTKAKCTQHTFILPRPNGYEALGVCRVCGFKRIHFNSVPESLNPWKLTKSTIGKKNKQKVTETLEAED